MDRDDSQAISQRFFGKYFYCTPVYNFINDRTFIDNFFMKMYNERKNCYQRISRKSETQSYRACKMAASCHVKDALSERTMLFSFGESKETKTGKLYKWS